jgi:hypothetical protein
MRITFQIAVILLAIALIAVPAVAGDWPVAKKDARHTSYADSALSPPTQAEASSRPRWSPTVSCTSLTMQAPRWSP